MSPADVAATVKARLAAELDDDLATLARIADTTARLLSPAADANDDWMRGLALAFEVERFYTAVESALVRCLRALDGDVPAGANWHLEVLRAASVALPGGRPRLVSAEAVADLRELLKFRHLARHGYEQEPVLARMQEHAERVARASEHVAQSLGSLRAWLLA